MVLKAFVEAFRKPMYVFIAFVVSWVVFTLSVWLPNFSLVSKVITTSSASFVEKVLLVLSLYSSIQTNFTIVSASYTIIIAVLFGINIAMLVYYIKTRQTKIATGGAATGIGGLVSGVFGIGCASCGTFILSTVLGFFGAAGIVTYLPFGGGEFGFLGVGLLGVSTYWIAKNINKPLVCES